MYTAEPGRVYDDRQAVLWVERGLVATDVQTDWLAARSPERFWVMLMNQTHAERTVSVKLDGAKIGLKSGEGVLYEGNADPLRAAAGASPRPAPALAGNAFSVTIAPLSLVTVGYPAEAREAFPASRPLPETHRTADAGAFGQAHAFSIRSPWGRDARYAVLTADAVADAQVTFTCEGVSRTCTRFPYEASFYPVKDPRAPVRITLLRAGKDAGAVDLN